MTNYDKMKEILVKYGMNQKVVNGFVKKLKIDESIYNYSEEERKWAMTRGFFPNKYNCRKGLTRSN